MQGAWLGRGFFLEAGLGNKAEVYGCSWGQDPRLRGWAEVCRSVGVSRGGALSWEAGPRSTGEPAGRAKG